jgi:hypothetical protein
MDRQVSAKSAMTVIALKCDNLRKDARINGMFAATFWLAAVAGCTPAGPHAGAPLASVTAPHTTILIDGSTRGRTFDGIGGVSSGGSSRLLFDYPEPARSDILDYMFKPGYGASLQLLKVEIGGEMNGTVGSEASHSRQPGDLNCNRGYEWWLMKEAKARNPNIKLIGLEWGAPGWFQDGFWSDDNITYIIQWIDCAEQQGLKIDYIGGWNESGFNPAWYVSFANRLKKKYPDIKIIAADNAHTAEWNVTTAMANDSAFNAATDIVGVHGPGGTRVDPEYSAVHPTETGLKLGKPLWASELSSLAHDVGAVPLARVFNRSYIDARITGQMIWTPLSAWYPTLPIADTGPIVAEWPFSGYYDVGKSVWTLAHTTQFTAPGWHYIDSGSKRLPSGATMVTLAAPDNSDYTVVVEAMDVTAPTTITVTLENLPSRKLEVWETDLGSEENIDRFRHVSAITPEQRTFTLRLEPRHIYTASTRIGAGKGTAVPSAGIEQRMALPYHENFESSGTGKLARYFSDVNGSFETAACSAGRTQTCLKQFVDRTPIEWHGPDMPPTTIMGDARWWGDYMVSSDVLIANGGYVELLGRVDGVGGDEFLSGYHLQLNDDGAWRLYTEDIAGDTLTLGSGRIASRPGKWRSLVLRFDGSQIRAVIDGDVATIVRDDHHRTGQIGLRTSRWTRSEFDNVAIEVTSPWPKFIPHREMTAAATSEHATNAFGYAYPASAAIDDRPETFWRSEWEPPAPLPQSITIDLGSVRQLGALVYHPRISGHWAAKSPGNPITRYAVYLSNDGQSFKKVATGTWRNTLAAAKVVSFANGARARYVRLEALGGTTGSDVSVTAGEIEISETPVNDPSPSVSNLHAWPGSAFARSKADGASATGNYISQNR